MGLGIAGFLYTSYAAFNMYHAMKNNKKHRLQVRLFEEGLPNDQIDFIVNSQLGGEKIYAKDNAYITTRREMDELKKISDYEWGLASPTPRQKSKN